MFVGCWKTYDVVDGIFEDVYHLRLSVFGSDVFVENSRTYIEDYEC
jgi:hypothetical protein